jgi:hypothetical protein
MDAAVAPGADQHTWWGIRSVATDVVLRTDHWTEADAVAAAAYNSVRWGKHVVAPPHADASGVALDTIRAGIKSAWATAHAATRKASELAVEGVAIAVLASYPTAKTLTISEGSGDEWSLTGETVLDGDGKQLADSRSDHTLFYDYVFPLLTNVDDHHFRDIFAGTADSGALAYWLIER